MVRQKLWQLAAGAAIFGDSLMIVLAAWILRSPSPIDRFPFNVLVDACLIGGLNITLIVLRRKLPQKILRSLWLVAILSNLILFAVLSLIGVLGVALLGGGGSGREIGARAQVELTLVVLAGLTVAISIVLNLVLIVRARDGK